MKTTNFDLAQFCIAVRKKESWQSKIFDNQLALKWTIEAELSDLGSQVLQGEALEAISELRRSVSTARQLDHELLNFESIHAFPVAEIDSDIKNALKYARGSKYGIREPELKEKGLGVLVSDNLVPVSLHQELVRELDALAAKEPRDFHPGSFGKVQDLIHPSLYPYVAGVTPTISEDVRPPPTSDGKFHTGINNRFTHKLSSRFAWIPSVFKMSPDGTDVRINSYINGLGTREEFPSLFRVLEKMFLLSLPHFERTEEMSKDYTPEESDSVRRWEERRTFALDNEGSLTRAMWDDFLDKHWDRWETEKAEEQRDKEELQKEIEEEDSVKRERFYNLGDELVASKHKGKELKVIVKAANYTLTPGREYEGSWHMEGMPHERIVASVIYYYDRDSAIEDHGLSFRKFRDGDLDFPDLEGSTYHHKACSNCPSDMTHSHLFSVLAQDFHVSFCGDSEDPENEDEDDEEEEDNFPSDWEIEVDYRGVQHPMSTSNISYFIDMGTVPTTRVRPGLSDSTGRMLSFPNWLQHKVENVKNNAPDIGSSRVATRKILCFFLVDDKVQNERYVSYHGFSFTGLEKMKVLTTSEVPMQMRKTNERTLLALLPTICETLTGTALPVELVVLIWNIMREGTMMRAEAETNRLTLIEDRRVTDPTRRNLGNDAYSLCEH
ncbi:hypothetical protein D9757_000817 [Collybiopsis confluens]|uniref:DUF4246 domain-containing protein n=1 Tax=Collybiopsis confluens TaxID=2823264 RepID=A0A8H5I0C3_9AGAR|nr:hypothetical protein D9757_000817 [Collybiopsis confluens]